MRASRTRIPPGGQRRLSGLVQMTTIGARRMTVTAAALALLFTAAMAGVFFAYSSSVMLGLDAIAPEHAVAAMRSINVKIQNPLFLGAFLLAPVASGTAALLVRRSGAPTAAWLFGVAALVYVLGALLPTVAINVPLNDALAGGHGSAAQLWADFGTRWTAWNAVRTIFSTASLMLVGAALRYWP
jgi:uncharacterized membrane protein